MMNQLLPGLRITLLLTVLTGVIYPALVTGMCQLLFPARANGSLILKDGQVVGSSLIGQNFTRPEYFHPRPSAAGSDGYDASSSSGSNLGPTSQKLADRVREAVDQFRKANPEQTGPIPADLVTTSASGLDPHISPAAAEAQAARVAKYRGITVPDVRTLIGTHKEGRDLGILGEPRINVLALNLALDSKFPLRR